MQVTKLNSGLVIPTPKPEPKPDKSKTYDYHVNHYGDYATVLRLLDWIKRNDGELISVARHGKPINRGILLPKEETGYVVTYWAEKQLDVEQKT